MVWLLCFPHSIGTRTRQQSIISDKKRTLPLWAAQPHSLPAECRKAAGFKKILARSVLRGQIILLCFNHLQTPQVFPVPALS